MNGNLPARRVGADGAARVDWRAVLSLAWPLMLNNGINGIIDLTDTWFISRLSVEATAGMAVVYLPNVVAQLAIGGAGLAVITFVSQAHGAGARAEAGGYVWTGLWCAALTIPFFILVAWAGPLLFARIGADDEVVAQAAAYWWPRQIGAAASVALWAVTGFFNGIGASRLALLIMIGVAALNIPLNALFMFGFGMGMAGAAWGTVAAQASGVTIAMAVFLGAPYAREYESRRHWRPRRATIAALFALGIPTGLAIAVDLVGATLFQFMMVRLGTVEAAASQVVSIITSLSYWPTIGIALAGTTLVGQAIGAGDKDWARRLGDAVTLLCVIYMGGYAVLLTVVGGWVLPAFASPGDAHAGEMLSVAAGILWFAIAYQAFDGVQFGRSFALRGAGDQRVPAMMLIGVSWCCFVPLAHMLTFAPGQGWVDFLPQFGYGAPGGWAALTIYVMALALTFDLRWRVGAWRRITLR